MADLCYGGPLRWRAAPDEDMIDVDVVVKQPQA